MSRVFQEQVSARSAGDGRLRNGMRGKDWWVVGDFPASAEQQRGNKQGEKRSVAHGRSFVRHPRTLGVLP